MARYTLKDARVTRGMTVRDLSRVSGLSVQVIRTIETRGTPFAVHDETAELLARALACKANEIEWPNGTTHIGRPPLTGSAIPARRVPGVCSVHFLEMSLTGICSFCEE